MSREHVSWGQKLVKAPRRFKGVQDGVYRVMIVDEKAEHGYTHYLGEYIKCPGKGCIACKSDIRKDERYGFNIVVYDLDQNQALKSPVTYKILPWICSYKVFNVLQESYQMNGPFWNYDFKLICTGAKFQAWQIIPFREAAWTMVPGLKDQVMRDYQTQAADVDKTMGRTVGSEAEMIKLIQDNPPKDDGGGFPRGGGGGQGRGNGGSMPLNEGGSRQAPPTAAKTEESLFGKGSRQVQSLVGSVVDSALASVGAPTAVVASDPVTITGNTAPSGQAGQFPPPISAETAMGGHMAVVDPPTPAPNLPGAAPSAGFADLITKLKGLDKKQ